MVKRGVIPNMGDVSKATRVQLSTLSGGGRRARRRSAKAAKPRKTRKAKRSSGGRKLKFGSPAWRKKYNKKKR